jgi:thiamine-phosphate pyrophosphorylase
MPIALARRIAPAGFVVGASVGNENEAALAGAADYWGVGPWRATGTKEDAGIGLGIDGFSRLQRLGNGKPVLAIGGVTPEDVREVLSAGGMGVAVASGILGGEEIEASARSYARSLMSRQPRG